MLLSLAQPLRVENGKARLSVPTGRGKDGQVLHRSVSSSLAPDGRQIDIAARWSRALDDGRTLRRVMTRPRPPISRSSPTGRPGSDVHRSRRSRNASDAIKPGMPARPSFPEGGLFVCPENREVCRGWQAWFRGPDRPTARVVLPDRTLAELRHLIGTVKTAILGATSNT